MYQSFNRVRYSFALCLLLIAGNFIHAQRPVSIGDPLTDLSLGTFFNDTLPAARLSDYQGKLVILDFWATWCSGCIQAFPRLDSLQASFGDSLKIILVNSRSTGNDEARVQTFFRKWEAMTNKQFSLPTIVMDTLLDQLFPHRVLPHYVWISGEGKLLALTSSDAVNEVNIRAALTNKVGGMEMKKDQDTERPIFSNPDLPTDRLLHYCVFIKGWFDGLGGGSGSRERDGVTCGRVFKNTALLDMYRTVAKAIHPGMNDKQIIMEVKDSSEFFPPAGEEERNSWYREHAHTLDLILPPEEAGQLYPRMLEALNWYSGFNGYFEKRRLQCLVLQKGSKRCWSKNHKGKKGGGEAGSSQAGVEMSNLVSYVNSFSDTLVLVETGWQIKPEFSLPSGKPDWLGFRKWIQENGFRLRLKWRWVEVFVIEKK